MALSSSRNPARFRSASTVDKRCARREGNGIAVNGNFLGPDNPSSGPHCAPTMTSLDSKTAVESPRSSPRFVATHDGFQREPAFVPACIATGPTDRAISNVCGRMYVCWRLYAACDMFNKSTETRSTVCSHRRRRHRFGSSAVRQAALRVSWRRRPPGPPGFGEWKRPGTSRRRSRATGPTPTDGPTGGLIDRLRGCADQEDFCCGT